MPPQTVLDFDNARHFLNQPTDRSSLFSTVDDAPQRRFAIVYHNIYQQRTRPVLSVDATLNVGPHIPV